MMSKKKDKAGEPKKTKAKSSKKAPQEITILNNETPAAAMETPTRSKPRRAVGGKRKTATLGFSTHDIALRAYYIAERRQSLNLPGDEMGDWVEAERQLRKEASKKSA